jgi:hypothetical protein
MTHYILNKRSPSRINVKDYGAVGDGVVDDTEAVRKAIATGMNVYIPAGLYLISGELELKYEGQHIEFESLAGSKSGNYIPKLFNNKVTKGGAAFLLKGNFPKRVRTRRRYRGSATDPQDAPLSTCFNIQAQGVTLTNASGILWCDYTDNSTTNMGTDCDTFIFVGSALHCTIDKCLILGYFRSCGVYVDATGASGVPRFPDLSGVPYPNTSIMHGADGFNMHYPFIVGSRAALRILGPKNDRPYDGAPYFDAVANKAVSDSRGRFGASDVIVYGGSFYSAEHHSGWRRKDPILEGGVINQNTLALEGDTIPCTLQIDGFRSHNRPFLGMQFYSSRFARHM